MQENTLNREKLITDYEEESETEGALRVGGKLYKPHMWKPGQSGNPGGRPKGQSMKEWTRARLAAMTDEERDAFLAGIPKTDLWRMAEGNPSEDKNVTITVPKPILGGLVLESEQIRGEIAEASTNPVDERNP